MGPRQEQWFYNQLKTSSTRGATWRVIGSQIIFSRLNQSVVYGNENPLNYDAWDGYQSNKNRTLSVLYDNKINNNVFLAGDSHASWVSDLTWLDHENYDPLTGAGAIGVEFAGSAISSPCPYGANITLDRANNYTDKLVEANPELQWSDLYYRGYFELHFSHAEVKAQFFGMPTLATRNNWEIPIANFSVLANENRLHRPVGHGMVESGTIKYGQRQETNVTVDTGDNTWFVSHEDIEVL